MVTMIGEFHMGGPIHRGAFPIDPPEEPPFDPADFPQYPPAENQAPGEL